MSEEAQNPKAGKGLGIVGLILGIVGLVLCWVLWLGLILAFVGLIMSFLGFSKAKKGGGSKGLVIAALIISLLGTLAGAWMTYQWMSVISTGMDAMENLDNADWNNAMDDLSGELDKLNEDLEDEITDSESE